MKILLTLLLVLILGGCATNAVFDPTKLDDMTPHHAPPIPKLEGKPMNVAVYSFKDLTGQRKPGESFAQLSTAVTQGGEGLLIMSMSEVGAGTWFNVIERAGLDDLIKERQLIRSTRESVEGDNAQKLAPLQFAGLLVSGGIIGYDSNVRTGGEGARFLGIGAVAEYREDVVTVNIRLVSVLTGEVLLTVISTNTVYSTAKSGSVFRFVDMGTELVELEAGETQNEPVTFAVKRAVDTAIVNLIHKGKEKGLWKFKE